MVGEHEMTSAGAWKIPKGYKRGMQTPSDQQPRVRLAVTAIQRELIAGGWLDAVPEQLDGGFGVKTEASVKAFQKRWGLVDDGIVGPKTAKKLWTPLYQSVQLRFGIPNNLLYGQGMLESALDPGAEGDNPNGPGWYDRGLHQINRHFHPEISDRQAFGNPEFAITWSAQRLMDAFERLGSWSCAIAYHNSPAWAIEWAETGVPPNPEIARYVELVREAATK